MTDKNRARWLYRLRYAVRYPGRIPGHLRRTARDIVLGLRAHGDHVRYYRGVMKSDTRRNAEGAVGSQTHERWHALGRMQFEYLHEHGLRPSDRMLEIGCGNLRAGRLVAAADDRRTRLLRSGARTGSQAAAYPVR